MDDASAKAKGSPASPAKAGGGKAAPGAGGGGKGGGIVGGADPAMGEGPGGGTSGPVSWGQLWQMPVLLLGVVLCVAGIILASKQKPGPDIAGMLDAAAKQLEVADFDKTRESLEHLKKLMPTAGPMMQARFKVINGDMIYLEQKAKGWDKAANHQQILDLYGEAAKLNFAFDPEHHQRWAQTLVSLDRHEEAMRMMEKAVGKDDPPRYRYLVIKQMIQKQLEKGGMDAGALQPLLNRFEHEVAMEPEAKVRRGEQIWATALEAKLLLDNGYGDRVIDQLQRQVILFMDGGGDGDLAPLLAALGAAYQQTGEYEKARTHYRLAQQKLQADAAETAELAAQILVGLGQIALIEQEQAGEADGLRMAMEYFVKAETEYRSTGAYLDALIGRAGCEARLGQHGDAIEHFGVAMRKIVEAGGPAKRAQQITTIIRQQHSMHFDRGDYALALAYIQLLGPLYREEWPADPLLQMAETYLALAKQTLAQAEKLGEGQEVSAFSSEPEKAEGNKTEKMEAAGDKAQAAGGHGNAGTEMAHAGKDAHGKQTGGHETKGETGHAGGGAGHGGAAEGSKQAGAESSHGKVAVMEAGEQGGRHGGMPSGGVVKARRSAREQFRVDAARLFEQAGDLFTQHAKAVTIRDLGAFSDSLWKSALCFEQAQQWKKAIEVLVQFSKSLPSDTRQLDAVYRLAMAQLANRQPAIAADLFKRLVDEHPQSPKAHESLVPLARCYMALKQYDQAKQELKKVVTDHPVLKPASADYREALMELGRLLYRLEEYEPAIERLSEAVERYGNTGDGPVLRFLLADAYRKSAMQIDQTLRQQLPLSKRQALGQERVRRLELAQGLYTQVVNDLEAKALGSLSQTQRLYRRNAYFYRADCTYDLKKFESAIVLYDTAVKRFENEPASLMALVQIVNANCEMGRLQEAKVANDRARAQLKRIPQEAFNDPSLPMNRQHWEDWLRFTSQFDLFATAGTGAMKGKTERGAGQTASGER